MSDVETKNFTITAPPEVMKRFERFLALLHYSSAWGHSATFAMPFDGDGWEKFQVYNFAPSFRGDVELIGSVGHSVEIALNDAYTCKSFETPRKHYLAKYNELLRDDVVIKRKEPV